MADENEVVAAETTPEAPPAVEAPPAAETAPVETATEAPAKSARESRREGLSAIFESKFKDAEGKDDRTPLEKTRDAKGQFQKPAAEVKPPEAVKPPEGQETKPAEKPKRIIKAPQSWSKEQRKLWDGLPDEAKAVIVKRENELGAVAQRTKTEIEQQWKPIQNFAQNFAQVITPFKSMMEQEAAAAGLPYNPLRTMQGLLQTVAMLRHPDKRVGAGALARAMLSYGINAEQMADALEGKGLKPGEQPIPQNVQPQQPQFNPDQLVARAKQEFMQQLQAQQQATYEAEAAEEVSSFADTHENYDSVKDRMADLIELNARRMAQLPPGQRVAMSFEDAYRIACLSDPELAPSVQEATVAAPPAAAAIKPPAQRVASSIRSKPGGSARAPAAMPKTRMEGLKQLWAQKFEGQ